MARALQCLNESNIDSGIGNTKITCYHREGVKKRIFYGQADRQRLPPHPPTPTPTPPYGQLFVNFFDVFFILDYDFCVLKRILRKKK